MSEVSHEVGLGPGARRVSPSLYLGLREGRVAESGPGPGPRATLAGGGAGGACRLRSGDGSGNGERRQVSQARETGPGAGANAERVPGAQMQSPAQLSSLEDLGLTKPRNEWGAEKRCA